MTRLDLLLKVSESIGMDNTEIEHLVERMVEFLILDFAIHNVRAENSLSFSSSPPSVDQMIKWFADKSVRKDRIPPTSGVAGFLSKYNFIAFSNRKRTSAVSNSLGCSFLTGCPYSDRQIADKMGVSIQQDHIIPISKGGDNHIWDFQPLCQFHNQLKSNALFWSPSEIMPIGGWCNGD